MDVSAPFNTEDLQLAKVAYDGWRSGSQGRANEGGSPHPEFDTLTEPDRYQWVLAVKALRQHLGI
jgi:hypothetical protein